MVTARTFPVWSDLVGQILLATRSGSEWEWADGEEGQLTHVEDSAGGEWGADGAGRGRVGEAGPGVHGEGVCAGVWRRGEEGRGGRG